MSDFLKTKPASPASVFRLECSNWLVALLAIVAAVVLLVCGCAASAPQPRFADLKPNASGLAPLPTTPALPPGNYTNRYGDVVLPYVEYETIPQ